MTARQFTATAFIILAFSLLLATIAYAAPSNNDAGAANTAIRSHASFAFVPSQDCGDSYEPNDSLSTAKDIPVGVSIDAFICTASDVDFFKFDVVAGQEINIDLTSLPADYDLVLYDPAGSGVADSTNSSLADEQISHTASDSGEYRVRVKGYEGAYDANDSYTLKVMVATPTCGDAYEWNDSFADAYPLSSQEMVDPTICTAEDEDWFKFNVSAGQIIDLDTTSMPADYDLYLYDPAGNLVDQSRQSGTADESISHAATANGWYRARVIGYNGAYDPIDDYGLRVNVKDAATPTPTATPATCNDPYEPNDSYAQAAPFPGNAPALHAFICTANDEDWFKFDVSAGQTIDLHLTDLPKDYNMILYKPDGDMAGASYNSGVADEHITHAAAVGGSYTARIFGSNDAYDSSRPYTLSLQISSATATPTPTPTVTPRPGATLTPTPVRLYTPMILRKR